MNARRFFIEDPSTGRIRFTRIGIEHFKERFARSGFRIEDIRDMTQFERAVDATFKREMRELGAKIRGQDPILDDVLQGAPGWENINP